MSAETAVQGALYEALMAVDFASQIATDVAIYDAAPQAEDGSFDGNWPYIEIGAIVFSPWDTATELGHNFVVRIHTRSDGKGMKEAKEIQGITYSALHRQSVSVDGFQTVTLQREMSDCFRAPDGTFHGVCEYRGLIATA